jgi:hypothetical protein
MALLAERRVGLLTRALGRFRFDNAKCRTDVGCQAASACVSVVARLHLYAPLEAFTEYIALSGASFMGSRSRGMEELPRSGDKRLRSFRNAAWRLHDFGLRKSSDILSGDAPMCRLR